MIRSKDVMFCLNMNIDETTRREGSESLFSTNILVQWLMFKHKTDPEA